MNEDSFRNFLKKQRRSKGTIATCIQLTSEFAAYLAHYRHGTDIDAAAPEDIHAFMAWMKKQRKALNSYLWALQRYYDFTGNTNMRKLAADLRQQEIGRKRGSRKSLKISNIEGIHAGQIEKLAEIGITDVKGMITNGKTEAERNVLAVKSELPLEAIQKLVRLADLTRIVDIKGARVRLLYEAGFDTIEKIATSDPEVLQQRLITVNTEKQILKRHPTLVEAKYWVSQSQQLKKLVEY